MVIKMPRIVESDRGQPVRVAPCDFLGLSVNLVGIAEMRNATEGVPYRFWPSSVGNGLRAVPLRGRGNKIRGEPFLG